MAPLATVTTVTSTGQKVPLCSCGWEGKRQPATREGTSAAWQETRHHAKHEHNMTAGRDRPTTGTADAAPGGETRG